MNEKFEEKTAEHAEHSDSKCDSDECFNKKEKIVDYLASIAKVGYCKFASGTVASLCGMIFYFAAIVLFKFFFPDYFDLFWAVLSIALLYVAIPISTKAEVLYDERDSHKIVIDEIVGYCFTMLFIPLTITSINLEAILSILKYAFIGFVLFRFFDIVKPYPIRQIQKLEKGLGVVMDDFVAGIYANICLQIIMVIIRLNLFR